ncbi:hypothetical protein N7449_004972 [Penicillium cf. viridicatum]|uniref:Xylanolytic transcriptional activator regulatory domain-containing protein n=1 Tax=Penicillium cf. viridicatum TaxID=2972119 RepID=A0A9W9SYK4_9EURO|nr:hypothetical protein N7449_004972 [Penicillium cf. viridicatum]
MEDLEVGVHVLPGLATLVDDANGSVTAAGQFALNANPKIQQFYEALLRDISLGVSAAVAKQIARALKNPSPSPTRNGRPDSPSSALSSSLGSLGDIDSVNEDLNMSEESRATGYMGKNSDVAWIQRLVSEITKQGNDGAASGSPRQYQLPVDSSIASMNYHLDHQRLFEPKVTDNFSLPPKALADQKWLAVLNMVLAIGSRIQRLSQQNSQSNDAEVFFARAKFLNISENVLYDRADLQQVQAEVLMAFYLLTLSQINRSWKMIGIATRSGIALGLNLRITNKKFDSESNAARTRLWWSIFYLEHILSIMTGRVSCIGDGSCPVGPPQPLNNSECSVPHLEPSPSIYFFHLVDLSFITQAITNRVYSTGILRHSWSQVESRIDLYGKKMDQWVSGLHPYFAFEGNQSDLFPGSKSYCQVSLALHYYGARIVLNRPCLTRPDIDQASGIRFSRSLFGNNSALACIRASLALLNVLPNRPDTDWGRFVATRWCFLHFLMQATTVLLLQTSIGPVPVKTKKDTTTEICAGAPGTTESPDIIIAAVKKALRWLHCLGGTDEASRRAFELCNSCIRRIALSKGLDLAGVPLTPVPFRMPSDVHYPQQQRGLSGETSRLPSQQQNQGSHSQKSPQQIDTYDEGGDEILFHESDETQTSFGSLQNPFAVLDTDTDMSELISHSTEATFEGILLTMMGSNV